MYGTYLTLCLLLAAFAIEPELTTRILTAASLKLQIFYINYRMKYMAWRMHKALSKLAKEAGYPTPGKFQFTNLWDREHP